MILQLNEQEITDILLAHLDQVMPNMVKDTQAMSINFSNTRKQGEGNSILVDIEFGSRSNVDKVYGVDPVEELQEQIQEVEQVVEAQEVIEPKFNEPVEVIEPKVIQLSDPFETDDQDDEVNPQDPIF